ncbi:hypothetical protein [Nitratireductor sp. ZSWI3]|uniref:hypothetical protein n=1 Tax=Nitratireductor sp. ZSWI3 TaxID=2966359 RepID=UPI002150519E|nr:hypothetical protein [Nitratireductor sp. ZSWI3]MCR4267095.1 hypothetical protein [Nitratireductor sp. ZSWI3]
MSVNLYETGPFRHVVDMEEPLTAIRDLLMALSMISETLGNTQGMVVQRLAMMGLNSLDDAEELRGELFDLTHPNRENLEREREKPTVADGAI